MKKIFTNILTKLAMIAVLATVTAVTAVAQSSIVINTTNSGVIGSYQDKEFDVNGITFKYTQWMKNTNIQAKKSTSNSCYNIDAIPGTITSIVVVQTGTARAITVYGGTSEKPTDKITSPATAATMTFDFTGKSYNYFSLTTPGNACYFDSITINYTTSGGTTPSISADNVNIAYSATEGSIAYTVNNGVEGGSISASVTEGNWITLGQGTTSPISFTCSANDTKVDRTATVTLTYTYNTNQTVTKAVTITQAGNPNIIDNISDITATGTYTVQGTIVAKSQRGFIVGDGTGYVYYYNPNYTQSDYAIGDKVKLAGSVSIYGGVFQFTNSASVNSSDTSNYVAEDPTALTGSQMDTRVGSTTPAQLSSYVQYEGVLSVSGNYYNITSIEGANTAKGSISYPINTDFASLNGKQVIVKGYYVGVSSSTYYNTMIGSVEEVKSTTPTITVTPASLTGFTYEVGNGPSTTKTFTVSGSNLTDNVGLSVSGSDFEISLSSDSGYAASLSLTQTAGEVAATTVFVRLKAGLNAGECSGTITLSSTGADDQTVSLAGEVTVPVLGYATLPFEWAGGTSANLSKEDGVTIFGNGSDYGDSHSPYYVKLDGDGDYIQVKTDSRPGKVTVGVKMIGGSNTSKITIQGSADGETFTDIEELTISGKQNDVLSLETSQDFAETDRYVRLLFTKGSNVGVGPITIAAYVAPSTDPSITVTPDTATPAANDVTGTLDISYANLVINDMTDFAVQFCDAQGNELASGSEPSWITALVAKQDPSIGTGYVLSYDMDANTGAERTAYFKVFALGANDYVYSNLVTITQAAYVIDYATLPFEFDGGKADIATTNGLTMSGLGSDYSSVPKLKFDGSGDWLQLEFNEIPGTLTFDIKGNGSGSDPWGGTFKVQTSTDGESYTDLATYTELSSTASEKEFEIALSVRFIKWIYVEKVTGNVALGNIKLTAKSAADSYIIEGALNNGQYWASFFCSLAGYTISEGAKAFTMNASNQLYLLGDGNVIPANTAVIIISDTDTITLTKTDNASATVYGGANILVGSDSDTAASGITGTPYVLSIVNNTLGFYKFTGTIPANKAYYIVNE